MVGHWPNKYVIGLTGNIGVGKSIVRQMLQHLGAYTIDADSLAHQAMLPGAPAYKPIVQAFGQFILGQDKKINRTLLGQIVFGNPEALKKLEDIVHPVVRQAVDILIKRAKQRVVVIEAIKLLEGNLAEAVDAVWVVDASPKTQYRRLVTKRKMTEAEARMRIQAQNPQAEKLKRADVIIDNDGDIEHSWKQIQQQWQQIKKHLSASAAAGAQPVADDSVRARSQNVTVRRGMPNNAQAIADFIRQQAGRDVTRMDVMVTFGQKSYLTAQADDSESLVGLMGWTVENLVTRMDEFYVAADARIADVTHAMVTAVEESSKELQSEVGFIFLSPDTQPATIRAFQADGYQPITLEEIKVPTWREEVEGAVSGQPMTILWKQLRKDRVLQPI